MKKYFAGIVVMLLFFSSVLSWGQAEKAAHRNKYPAPNLKPQEFEPYLEKHPADEAYRGSALVWYDRREKDYQKLRQHTLLMVKYHPANRYIGFTNTAVFYVLSGYRAEVISLLEKQIQQGKREAGIYWNLAYLCEKGAIPPVVTEPGKRERFLKYMSLPKSTKLLQSVDKNLAQKSMRYYRLAIQEGEKQKDETIVELSKERLARLEKRLNTTAKK